MADKSFSLNQYPQMTQTSERRLIQPLLDQGLFESTTIKRYLATYPCAKEGEKADVVIKLLCELWDKKYLFKAFKSFDFFLATSGKRGHFIHQFEVYLLGLNFLLYFSRSKEKLESDFGFKTFDDVLFAWLITASTHDFGYPVEGAHKILNKLSNLYEEFRLPYLAEKFKAGEFKQVIEKERDLSTLFLEKPSGKLNGEYIDLRAFVNQSIATSLGITIKDAEAIGEKSMANNCHGYASALILSRLLLMDVFDPGLSINQGKKSSIYLQLEKASGAIALHNLKPKEARRFISKIKYERNPLAFLLYIIDNIQDWNRNLFPDDDYAEYKLNNYHLDDGIMIIEYSIVHKDWTPERTKKVDEFVLEKANSLKLVLPPSRKPLFDLKLVLLFERSDGFTYAPLEYTI